MDQSNDLCYIDELLPECKNHIFQFLSLQDCLRFTSTSKRSLISALPQLWQRRQEQFYQRYCYQIESPNLLQRWSKKWDPASAADTTTKSAEDDTIFCSPLVDQNHWHVIPAVGERITQLYQCVPATHPSNNELRALKTDLEQDGNSSKKSQRTTMNSADDHDHFQATTSPLQELRNCTRAHQLHASILSMSTVKCNPRRCDRYSTTARTRIGSKNVANNNSLSATLETYMGDVLVSCYLMGHKISGILEGGPSLDDWNQHVLSLLRPVEAQKALSWYQYWVYLHSTLLRTFPFSVEHAAILLGSSKSGILGRSIPQGLSYIHPHYCYMGQEPKQVEMTTKIVRTLLLRLANHEADAEPPSTLLRMAHQTTMNQFGPLGPAFRGRDEIRTRIMNPFSLLHRLHHPSYALASTWFLVEQKEHIVLDSRTFHAWFRGTDTVVGWMLELKQECSKSRPMTVMPPVVTVEPIAVSAFLTDNAIQ
ncbi:unnamed protein product [Cylindrotheca closterium]|uniref:F-box domain-containing protein n=1 Tax=Cylindrotheca closterium TaxID=2856 RepID=A0AAD2GB73_9STRA|nr:unnamed protein product [Cylindrotheca closterium]